MAKENKLVFLPVGANDLGLDPIKKHRMYCMCNTKGKHFADYRPNKVKYGSGLNDRCPVCKMYYFTFVEKGGAKANAKYLCTKQG